MIQILSVPTHHPVFGLCCFDKALRVIFRIHKKLVLTAFIRDFLLQDIVFGRLISTK